MGQIQLFPTAVGNPFTPIPKHPKSHVRGWALHWAETLGDGTDVMGKGDDYSGLTTLFFDHGVNSEPGQMNLFGGITEDCVDSIEQIVENKALDILGLDAPIPIHVYQPSLYKRVGLPSSSKRLTVRLVDALIDKLKKNDGMYLRQKDFIKGAKCLTIGDSHATAYAPKGSPVLRYNGMTLRGAIKRKTILLEAAQNRDRIESMTIVLGSIDIRHHVGLEKDPWDEVSLMTYALYEHALFVSEEYGINVELAAPVPVEFEGRRIPKTGWLNGRPFTGNQADRAMWTELFTHQVRVSGMSSVVPPRQWYTMDPEEYAKEIMELASSVHIAPPHYRRHGGWDVLSHA